MEGGKDYRRIESGSVAPVKLEDVERVLEEWREDDHRDLQHGAGMAGWPVAEDDGSQPDVTAVKSPRFYNTAAEDETTINAAISSATGETVFDEITWQPTTLKVYGRTFTVPYTLNGTIRWTFDDLCKGSFGPADYITLASTFHTLILTDVPILTFLMKNEARRFITLLDALYECRCKLYIHAAAGPDDLFFPDKDEGREGEQGDSVYSETISEVYQDATAAI